MMTYVPPGELRPLPREVEIGHAEIQRLADRLAQDDVPFGPRTQAAMAEWLAAILCGYRLELLAGRRLLGR